MSFIYERGWRQGFKSAGFPGQSNPLSSCASTLACVTTAAAEYSHNQASVASIKWSVVTGADEELKLSMDFLRPAFGEVGTPAQTDSAECLV